MNLSLTCVCARSRSRIESDNRFPTYTLDQNDVMDFSSSMDGWESEMLTHSRRDQPLSYVDMPNSSQLPNVSRSSRTALDVPSHMSASPIYSAKQGDLNDRIEFILKCTQASGFDSFDSLVMDYYNEDFGETSSVANEQRLNRNRGLPKFISEIFQATDHWSDWERRGSREEILKVTDNLLITEGEHARHHLKLDINSTLESQNYSNGVPTSHIVGVKKTIQNEVRTHCYTITLLLLLQ